MPTIMTGAFGQWQATELSQKSRPACSNPILMFHSNMYTAWLDRKNYEEKTNIAYNLTNAVSFYKQSAYEKLNKKKLLNGKNSYNFLTLSSQPMLKSWQWYIQDLKCHFLGFLWA